MSRLKEIVLAAWVCSMAGAGAQAPSQHAEGMWPAPEALQLSGQFAFTHDPSIGEDHGKYYVFATGTAYAPLPPDSPKDAKPAAIGQLPIRCSSDLHEWKRCGEVFPGIPQWIRTLSPKTPELWAPDISYFDGLYHLYYAFSVFGKNTSGIALATNETLDPASPKYKWADKGLVLQSKLEDDFNAIDPNLILDAKGQAWLAFGSFWSGIKMRKIDRRTGLLAADDPRLYSLAERTGAMTVAPRNPDLPPDAEAVEAPFVFRHGDYFYLFVSWDLCCRGTKSTYRTMVGRSKIVTGPYLDRDGKPLAAGGGTQILQPNAAWLGPGGESLLHTNHGDLMVFHAYSRKDGHPALQISTVAWKDGWPEVALPNGPAE